MAIFPPAVSGTSGSNYNPRNTSMYSPQGHFLRGACGYNFRLPPLRVRDLRLDLEKTISFSDSLERADVAIGPFNRCRCHVWPVRGTGPTVGGRSVRGMGQDTVMTLVYHTLESVKTSFSRFYPYP